MRVATDTRAVGEAAAIAIGGTIGLDAMFGGPISGASMNPMRSAGPAIVSGDLHALWLYIVAPVHRRVARCAHVSARPRGTRAVSRVLFVCTANSGRSVMAERIFRRDAGGRHEARSAGSAPGAAPHPVVVEALAEIGIDASAHVPHALDQERIDWADVIVATCDDACPVVPGKRYIAWNLPDPKGRPLDEVRAIRDDIAVRVGELVRELDD